MDMEVYDLKLGVGAKVPRLDDDSRGVVAVKLLDAVQTIADVLTVNDGGKGWTVTFDPDVNAYTDRAANKRSIVVSGKPLFDAKVGTPLRDVAKVMTGFVVHEVGHADPNLDFFSAVRKRWPNKALPLTLANIIEDVVLEARACERYNGFADHGEGNIFQPTLEWVAERTCPKTPLEWSGSTGHKVNVTGQIIRYRDYVSFSADPVTQTHLRWVEDEWMPGITIDLTPSGCVELIERWLDHVKATLPDDLPEEEPPTESGPAPSGQTLPDEDEDESEPNGSGDGDEEGEPTEGDDGEGNGDGDSDDEADAEGEGSGDADGDGDTEGDGEGEGQGEGDGESGRSGDGNDADHGARTTADKGANDGPGAGGSGQAVADAGDPLDDYEPEDLQSSFDEASKPEGQNHQQNELSRSEELERVTTRVDAGAFGKMRVIFR